MNVNAAAFRNFEIVTALGVLATITVGLRFVARRLLKAPHWADDYWIVVSLIFMYGLFADSTISMYPFPNLHILPTSNMGTCVVVFAGGIGKHLTELTPSEHRIFLRVSAYHVHC